MTASPPSFKKILVADNERDIVQLLQMRFEALNYKVFTAYDGEEALETAKREKPKLILLDIMMPKLNGYQVCRALKGKPETNEIKIILLTAKNQESDKYWAKEVGADAFLVKPFDMEELSEIVGIYTEE